MKEIKLIPLIHHNGHQIAIRFAYDDEIRLHLIELENVQWSKAHKTFYIPYSVENKKKIYNHLRIKNWFVDYSALKINKKNVKTVTNIVLPGLYES